MPRLGNIYGNPIETFAISIISEKTKQRIRELFCRHNYKIDHLMGMSGKMIKALKGMPTTVYDISYTRYYCSKCGKIFVEQEDEFIF